MLSRITHVTLVKLFIFVTEMAFKRIALASTLLLTAKAYQTEEEDPYYYYYGLPTPENALHSGYSISTGRQAFLDGGGLGVDVDPGATLGALALVSFEFQAKTEEIDDA